VSVPVKAFTEAKFTEGHFFDGSSIAGWKSIEASDMLLMPDPDSARMDPFTDEPVLNITCDVTEPADGRAMTAIRAPSPSALKRTSNQPGSAIPRKLAPNRNFSFSIR
jgi:glutamine synthetase